VRSPRATTLVEDQRLAGARWNFPIEINLDPIEVGTRWSEKPFEGGRGFIHGKFSSIGSSRPAIASMRYQMLLIDKSGCSVISAKT
jgi:hypothetical protein